MLEMRNCVQLLTLVIPTPTTYTFLCWDMSARQYYLDFLDLCWARSGHAPLTPIYAIAVYFRKLFTDVTY